MTIRPTLPLILAVVWGCTPTAPLLPGTDAGTVADGVARDQPSSTDAGVEAPACTSDRDCSALGMVCNVDTSRCVGCNAQADCTGSLLCIGHSCRAVTRCTTSVMCPGQVCSTSLGYCVDCNTDRECPASQMCMGSVCVSRPSPVDAGSTDVPMAVDVPSSTDVPMAVDVPSSTDVPMTVDVPPVVDVPMAVDVPPAVDVPAAIDAPMEVDSGSDSRCPADMAFIPAGTFTMGDPMTDNPTARPVHSVTMAAYCMDLTEVTVAAYRSCVPAGCSTPSTSGGCNWAVSGRDDHPINCVDWSQARAYCQWRGGSLPTEAQWEYAARGTDGRIYPWGNTAPSSQLCWSGVAGTCPVRSYPAGNSPFGLFDMAGDGWEWTADWYAAYGPTPLTNPTGPSVGATRVTRGGSWANSAASIMRATTRDAKIPTERNMYTGFRCAHAPL